jgi:hypothetical protein
MGLSRRSARAGRHADRWFRETYRPWRRKARLAFAIVAPVMGGLMMAMALIWPPWTQFYAGCTVGVLCGLYAGLIDSPPEWIERKRRGRDGERRTEKHLRALERRGWRVVHDIEQPWGNFDHVLVGPPGVFLLETKNLTGEASLIDGRLVIRRGTDERDSWTLARPIHKGVKDASFALREELLRRTGVRWVQGVVVLWSDFPAGEVKNDGVFYVHGDRLRDWLERQRPELTPDAVRRAGDHLEHLETAGFRPTGDLTASARRRTATR